jgi:hypothetical protein
MMIQEIPECDLEFISSVSTQQMRGNQCRKGFGCGIPVSQIEMPSLRGSLFKAH